MKKKKKKKVTHQNNAICFNPKLYKSIHSRYGIKNVILVHKKPTLLFYYIILQHLIY